MPGEGTHSYRLYEALQAGAIPVLLGRSARPLEPLIPWSECAIIAEDVSPEGLRYLEASLRLMPGDTLARMQRRGRSVFAAHFKDLASQVNSAFALLAHRWDGVIRGMQGEMEAEGRRRALAAGGEGAGSGGSGSSSSSSGSGSGSASGGGGSREGSVGVEEQAVLPAGASGVASVVPSAAQLQPPPPPATTQDPSGTAAAMAAAALSAGSPGAQGAAAAAAAAATAAAAAAALPLAPTNALPPAVQASLQRHRGLLDAAGASIQLAAAQLAGLRAQLTGIVAKGQADSSSSSSSLQEVRAALGPHSPPAAAALAHLSTAVSSWLRWLQAAVPDPSQRTSLPPLRALLVDLYSTLAQSYGLAGEWRHAATASHAVMLHMGPERSREAGMADTQRLRTANMDSRRQPAPWGSSSSSSGSQAQLLYRLVDDMQPSYAQFGTQEGSSSAGGAGAAAAASTSHHVLPGYGALAHFLGPQPLGGIGLPSLVLPVDLRVASAAVGAVQRGEAPVAQLPEMLMRTLGSSAPVAHALVTESVLKGVATRLRGGGGAGAGSGGSGGGGAALLPPNPHPSLSAFMGLHGVPLVPPVASLAAAAAAPPASGLPTHTPPQPTPTQAQLSTSIGRVAIVSLCAYDPAKTNLTTLSSRNLNAYCQLHGYECYLASASFDPDRPIAWTKVLLAAALLPRVDWVLWRDCDTFFAAPEVTVESLIASAGVARAVIGAAAAAELGGRGALAPLQAAALAAPAACPLTLPPSSSAAAAAGGGAAAQALPLASSTLDLVISEDGFLLNTGVWAVRNSAWGLGWLRRVYGEAVQQGRHAGLSPFGVEWVGALLEEAGQAAAAAGGAAGGGGGALDAQLALLARLGITVSPASHAAQRAMVAAANATASPTGSPAGVQEVWVRALAGMKEARVRERLGASLVGSRMWEQGTALEHFCMRGAIVEAAAAAAGGYGNGSRVEALVCEEGIFASGEEPPAAPAAAASEAGRVCDEGSAGAQLSPWMDSLHTQFVPQAWLNSYPYLIARQLQEVGPFVPGRAEPVLTPLHAPYQPGDWCISFSGCTAYYTQDTCEGLFRDGAELAHKAIVDFASRTGRLELIREQGAPPSVSGLSSSDAA